MIKVKKQEEAFCLHKFLEVFGSRLNDDIVTINKLKSS